MVWQPTHGSHQGGNPLLGSGYRGEQRDPRAQGGPGRVGDTWYQQQYRSMYDQMRSRYQPQWDQTVRKATAFGSRDWTGEAVRFAREDAAKQRQAQESKMRSYGMGELALGNDYREEALKRERDAVTRAQMDAQGMQANAYQTATSMIDRASGADLAALVNKLQSLNSGSSDYQDLLRLLLPMMQQRGAVDYRNNRGGGGGIPPVVPNAPAGSL